MNSIKIGIAGCLGRMGSELVKAACSDPTVDFIGGFENANNKNIGKSFNEILNVHNNIVITKDPGEIFEKANVVIDFTTPESTLINLRIAKNSKTSLVIGTTGLSDEIIKTIHDNSNIIPILQSANMSIGINLLLNFVEKASEKLISEKYDAEISESHHRHKLDSPSGTALVLGETIAKSRNVNFNKNKVLDRSSKNIKRKIGEIGFSVTRAGEIAGEHTVSFIGDNDQIELTHRAKNRSIFVEGAMSAAKWLVNQNPGLYSMKNILGT